MKKEGRTPNGGDYSEIIFFDKNGAVVNDKALAVKAVIRECKADGTIIAETFAEINGGENAKPKREH